MLVVAAVSAGEFGTCGDNLTWTTDDSGVLTISRTGDMDNFEYLDLGPGTKCGM